MALANNAKNGKDIQYYCLCDMIWLSMPVFLSTNNKTRPSKMGIYHRDQFGKI